VPNPLRRMVPQLSKGHKYDSAGGGLSMRIRSADDGISGDGHAPSLSLEPGVCTLQSSCSEQELQYEIIQINIWYYGYLRENHQLPRRRRQN
jgi:hypothetical protein